MHQFSLSRSRGHLGLLLAAMLIGAAVSAVTMPVQSACAQSSDGDTGTITVRVNGLSNSKGAVRAELTTAENYDTEGNVRAAELPIQDASAQWTITGVPHGTYAVRLYHDQDDDDELDTNIFGVPQEPFGFSNNARGTMGPPGFQEASFTLGSDSLSISITAE